MPPTPLSVYVFSKRAQTLPGRRQLCPLACTPIVTTPVAPLNHIDRDGLEAIFLSRTAVLRNQTTA
jgi:hypothetical protein